MASLANLAGTSEQLLSLFVAELSKPVYGITLPERQYVAPGTLVAWDAEQFVVSLIGITPGQPGAPSLIPTHPEAASFHAEWAVMLLRDVSGLFGEGPGGVMIPPMADIDIDGQTTITDAAALIQAGMAIWAAGSFIQIGEGFVLGPLSSFGPEGMLAGSRLSITASLT